MRVRQLVKSAMDDGGPMSFRLRVRRDSGRYHDGAGTVARPSFANVAIRYLDAQPDAAI